MKRLHKFILRSFFGPMVMTFFIVMFILLLQFLWKYIDDLVGKGLEFNIILELLFYVSAGLVPMALPLSVLLASLMTMGNLGEHNELLAMKSAGISLPRIMLPMAVVSVAITVVGFLFADYVVPVATLRATGLIRSVQEQRPELAIRPGVIYGDISGYSIRVGGKDPSTQEMRDVMIYDHSGDQGNVSVVKATRGHIQVSKDKTRLTLELYDGKMFEESDPDALSKSDTKFAARWGSYKRQKVVRTLEGFAFERKGDDSFVKSFRVMNTHQLAHASDSMRQDAMEYTQAQYHALAHADLLQYRLPDTVEAHDTLNFQACFDTLSPSTKLRVLTQANSNAQSLKNQIQVAGSELTYRLKTEARFSIEYHRKYTLALACLIFFLIGAPLGAIIRKGGLGVPVIISVVFFVIYYVISISGEKMVRGLKIGEVAGMWGSTWILLPIAVFLIYKATTDSVILNSEWYLNTLLAPVKRIKKLFGRKQKGRKDVLVIGKSKP